MHKIIEFVWQIVVYLLIVLFLFFVFRKLGIGTDSSIITLPIGSALAWLIFEIGSRIFQILK